MYFPFDLRYEGIQIICCGDFLQIPPVADKSKPGKFHFKFVQEVYISSVEYFANFKYLLLKLEIFFFGFFLLTRLVSFCFESEAWRNAIQYQIELTHVFRQVSKSHIIEE